MVNQNALGKDEHHAPARQTDQRLSEARRLLAELKEAEGTAALSPARRLTDLLEDLLEGREGEPR